MVEEAADPQKMDIAELDAQEVRAVQFIAVVGVLLLFLLDARPWMAPELVTDADGSVRAAYVLRDGDNPVLLDFQTRNIIYLDAPMRDRAVCDAGSDWFVGPNLYSVLGRGRPAYPACHPVVTANDDTPQVSP